VQELLARAYLRLAVGRGFSRASQITSPDSPALRPRQRTGNLRPVERPWRPV